MIFNWDHPTIPQYPGLICAVIWPTSGEVAPPSGTKHDERITMGMRVGVQQADVFMGGFG